MQALLLAGGKGHRLDTVAAGSNKCMIPVEGHPVIWYSLRALHAAGFAETVVVVGYRAEEVINAFGTDFHGMRLTYAIQSEQRGVIHAMETARKYLRGPFLLSMADEIHLGPAIQGLLDSYAAGGKAAVCGVVSEARRERIRQTYAILTVGQQVLRLIEKPTNPPNDWMGTGLCIFREDMLDFLEQTPVNPYRGEREMPDWIQLAIDMGERVEFFEVSQGYVNINYPDDLDAARTLLRDASSRIPDRISDTVATAAAPG